MKPVKRHEHQQSRSQRRGFRDGPVGAAPQVGSWRKCVRWHPRNSSAHRVYLMCMPFCGKVNSELGL
ncbi:unnamed protein product [Hymenolepis diminuta]|uniref:Uncharacterized protein n=1 Tax=Hymenolepis diminuta TaxID=6216 RepID=A0A564YEQ5_HYMDI|nr:unnamed protein product [Hymenolepis diminuta]VUZ45218.1 unnamed protein product [Hymenolepis diminuta]